MCIASGLWAVNIAVWFIIRMSCRQEIEPGQLCKKLCEMDPFTIISPTERLISYLDCQILRKQGTCLSILPWPNVFGTEIITF